MTSSEALAILGLNAAATATEIKRAYRELVKVWHPDRFGEDLLLRQRAENELKRINIAFQALQSYIPNGPPTSAGSTGAPPPRPHPHPAQPDRKADGQNSSQVFVGKSSWSTVGSWAARILTLAAIVSMRYACADHPTQTSSNATAENSNTNVALYDQPPFQREVYASPNSASSGSIQSTNPVAEPRHRSPERPPLLERERGVAEAKGNQATTSVRSYDDLSNSERSSLESACYIAKISEGPASYDRCKQNQLTLLSKSPSTPDMSSLSSVDRSSVDSACYIARISEGPASYNNCVTRQLWALVRSPSRPDLSSLSADETSSIESACYIARISEGPASYNRCLVEKLREMNRH